jgi:hypothetical protein
MRKLVVFITGMVLFIQQGYTQPNRTSWLENFDGNTIPPTGWTVTSGTWQSNTSFYQSSPKSYRGLVPNQMGNFTILQTPSYDCTPYDYVYLRFSHICKVSPKDVASIEYRINGTGVWTALPKSTYLGNAKDYDKVGFNAASYSDWKANDSTQQPASTWWVGEKFDIASVAARSQI